MEDTRGHVSSEKTYVVWAISHKGVYTTDLCGYYHHIISHMIIGWDKFSIRGSCVSSTLFKG